MEKTQGITAYVRELSESIGPVFGGGSTADRAKEVARMVVADGDREMLIQLVAEGCELHLRREVSDMRRAANRAAKENAVLALNGALPNTVAQLGFLDTYPIVIQGETVLSLRMATARDIRSARLRIAGQRRGVEQTERKLLAIESLLAGLPTDETIGSLVQRGVLDASLLEQSA